MVASLTVVLSVHYRGENEMITLTVNNMTCGSCARHIIDAVKGLDPDAQLTIDLPTRAVTVNSQQPVGSIVNAIDAMDYEVAVTDK